MKSTLSVYVLSFSFLLISTQGVFGQDKVSGGSGSFFLGSKLYHVESYEFFLEKGVENLNNNLISIGGGGYHLYKNLMLGGQGFYQAGKNRDVTLGGPQQDSQNYTYSLSGGGGYLTLGYVIHSTSSVLVFPQMGIGYESLGLEKILNGNRTLNRREALSSEYYWSSPMLDFSTGVDWFPLNKKGLKVGVRIGYKFSIQRDNKWTHSGGEFVGSNLPKNNLNGVYFNLAVGGGWMNFDNK